jgi:putative ABC transport system permease protein
VLVSFTAAFAGAFSAVRSVVKLPPAEAMRAPTPARYRRTIVDRLGLAGVVGPSAHMVVRELERRPFRALLSSLAIAASVGLMVVGGWYYDGIGELVRTQFHEIMREDIAVTFVHTQPERALRDLGHVPGVLEVEGLRAVPVHLRAGHVTRSVVIFGHPADAELRMPRDSSARAVPLPPDGLVLTDVLGRLLGVAVGDTVEVDVDEGSHDKTSIAVSGFIAEPFGLNGHMPADALGRLLGEARNTNVALLRIDPNASSEIDARLKDMPNVASVARHSTMLERFEEESGKMIATVAVIIMAFAATITIGVVYNDARIALSIRARDLASLRVLGFTRAEISRMLLGEMSVPVLLALPLGLAFGRLLVTGLASTVDPEQWRMPVLITARSYAMAAAVALAAAAISALLVRRRLDKLDLIGVLKTRE